MKDLGTVKYLLGLEIERTAGGFFVSPQKYARDLLKEHNLQNYTPLKLPMDLHLKFTPEKGDPLPSPYPYQRLLGKLIYLIVTRLDISFSVHILTQFMHQPSTVHM